VGDDKICARENWRGGDGEQGAYARGETPEEGDREMRRELCVGVRNGRLKEWGGTWWITNVWGRGHAHAGSFRMRAL